MAAALLSTEPVASLALVSGVALSMRRMPLTSVQSLSESGTPVLRSRVRETKRKRKEGRKEGSKEGGKKVTGIIRALLDE